MEKINFTKIKHDINGNPRLVCHFLKLVPDLQVDYDKGMTVPKLYEIAVYRAHKIGGRKYNTKAYGGGIVFQAYSENELQKEIEKVVNQERI